MKAKLGAIFLVSVLAIAGAGAAYALWFEDLYIWTDIWTGEVDVEWSVGYWDSNETKNVSTGGIYISDTAPNTLRCWVRNAYPCVEYYWYFDIHCIGSIPVHFDGFYIQDTTTLNTSWIEDQEILIYLLVKADGTKIYFDNPIPLWSIQLHEGESVYGYLMLHFNNDLPEDEFFTYDFMVRAHQYNEDSGL